MELEKLHTTFYYLYFLLIKLQNACFRLTKTGVL